MKKRYARILAATLSAAMVFTSAPASVFDTGVIEAKAAATPITAGYTNLTAVETALNNTAAINIVVPKGTDLGSDTVKTAVKNAIVAKAPADITVKSVMTVASGPAGLPAAANQTYTASVTFVQKCNNPEDGDTNDTCDGCSTAVTDFDDFATHKITKNVNFTAVNISGGVAYDSVQQAIATANTILNDVKWSKAYTAFKNANDTVKNVAIAAVAAKTGTLQAAGFENVTLTPVTATDTTNAAKTYNDFKSGNVSFAVTVDWYSTEGKQTLSLGNRPFTIAKDAAATGLADFEIATADFVIDSTVSPQNTAGILAALTNKKNAQGDTVTSETGCATYTVDATSLADLLKIKVDGTTHELVFVKFVHNADVVDYSAYGDAFHLQGGSEGYFEKKIVVTVKGKQAALTTINLADVKYAYGDTKVTLDNTMATKYKVVGYLNDDLAKVSAGTLNVKLETTDTFDTKEINVADTLKTLQTGADQNGNAWKSTWSFDSATNKFTVILPMPTASARTINIKDIVWPTKLKNGATTIPYLTQLSSVELEETATTKAGLGKFVLVYHKDDTHIDAKKDYLADPSYKKYCIRFVPTAGKVKVANPAAGNVDHYGVGDIFQANDANTAVSSTAAEVTIEKKNCISLTAGKAVVAAKDIEITYKGVDDDSKYGTTYANIQASVTFPEAAKATGTYTLKDAKLDDLLKPGKNTITYVYKVNDFDRYEVEGGTETKEVSFDVTIKQPVLKAKVTAAPSSFAKVDAKNTTPVTLSVGYDWENVRNTGNNLNPANELKTTKYQWSSASKGQIYNATLSSYVVNVTEVMTDAFTCARTVEIKPGLDAKKTEMYKTLIGNGTLVSDPLSVYVTNMDITRMPENGDLGQNIIYGTVNQTASALVGLDAGFSIKSVTWTIVNNDTKESVTVDGKLSANNTISCDVPKDTQVGKYTMSATIVAASSTEEQKAVVDYTFEIKKATLSADDEKLLAKINVAEADKAVKYGTKLKDIKLAIPEGSEKFGSYQWLNGETYVSTEDRTYTARFVANDFARRNYSDWDTVAGDVKVKGTQNYEISGIKATKKGDLVLTANDVVVTLGETVPETTYTATGLVGTDTVEGLGLVVKVDVDTTIADLTKVGTYTGAAVVTAKHYDKTNENIDDIENYNVKVVAGNVIVKAKDVAPSVKPTPAPVKQATAAAPKAAKAKAKVKVGKKYTLKVKLKAGTKATVKKIKWTSSKKSVATVSSKGKVTAKKAGKATIYARVYFKDGSMKKVKFTVTVK